MKLEEAVEKLEQRLQPQKYGGKCVLGYSLKYCFGKSDLEVIETVLKYIKEESIPKAVVEEKMSNIKKTQKQQDEDGWYGRYKEYGGKHNFEKQYAYTNGKRDILQEILNKGE